MSIGQMGTNSIMLEATNLSGAPLAGIKVYVKGGYKKYTLTSNTSYYYDNFTPTDVRPTTDASGLAGVLNLPPINSYIFCGNDGAQNCKIGTTTYYFAAAIPYGGTNVLSPITVPEYDPYDPPSVTYDYGGTAYLQKVRLMFTTSSTMPRVFAVSPGTVSVSGGGLGSMAIVLNGNNLTGATATFTQGANTFSGTGCTTSAVQLTCTYDFTAAVQGSMQLSVTNGAGTLTLPTTPLGGINVTP